MSTKRVASPCRGQCDVDKQTGVCHGCFRKIDEIKTWHRLSDEKKLLYLDLAQGRRDSYLQNFSKTKFELDENSKFRKNPCSGQCQIDSKSFLCKGCYMYPEEIKNWHIFTATKQHRLIRDVENRKIKHGER